MVTVPSWDLIITIFFIMGIAYGFLLQRERVLATIIAVYIAWAVSVAWSKVIFELFTGQAILFKQLWFRTNTTLFNVQTTIFVIFTVLLSLKGEFADITKRAVGASNPIIVFLYSFLNTGLILSTIMNFMGPTAQADLMRQSHLAELVITYKTWWIVAPAVLMIVAGLRKGPAMIQAPPPPPQQ